MKQNKYIISNYEDLLKVVVDILHVNNIKYWITDGTLLGVIRDGSLIPWDDDIDIAVHSDVYTQDFIKSLFVDHGFSYIETLPEMSCLHFEINGFTFDVSFYKKKSNNSVVKWKKKPKNYFINIYLSIVNHLFAYDVNSCRHFKSTMRFIFLYLLNFILIRKVKLALYRHARKQYVEVLMEIPTNFLKPSNLSYKNTILMVPTKSKEVLNICYGENWKRPIKEYISDRFL
jgi:hypothetical protein